MLELVETGVKALFRALSAWVNAGDEERIQIEAKTRSLVGSLDASFAAADAKDAAATKAARDAIAKTEDETTKP